MYQYIPAPPNEVVLGALTYFIYMNVFAQWVSHSEVYLHPFSPTSPRHRIEPFSCVRTDINNKTYTYPWCPRNSISRARDCEPSSYKNIWICKDYGMQVGTMYTYIYNRFQVDRDIYTYINMLLGWTRNKLRHPTRGEYIRNVIYEGILSWSVYADAVGIRADDRYTISIVHERYTDVDECGDPVK